MKLTPSMVTFSIPGLVMDQAEGSSIYQQPGETSGYHPALYPALKGAVGRKRGKSHTYTITVPVEAARDFAEFCEDMIAPCRDNEETSVVRALVVTAERIDRLIREAS